MTDTGILLPGISDGEYMWSVYVEDKGGNTSSWSDTWGFGVDTTPPSKVTLLSPADEEEIDELPSSLIWDEAIDDGIGVSGYILQIST